MKILILIVSLLVLPTHCNNKQSSSTNNLKEQEQIITITYEANSRGFFEEIAISNDTVIICNDIHRKSYKTYTSKKQDWEDCLELLSKIDLEGLSKLEAPTSMRHIDGAAHATLTIKDGYKQIRSSSFDHGHPPEEIKALVEKLLSIKKVAIKQ